MGKTSRPSCSAKAPRLAKRPSFGGVHPTAKPWRRRRNSCPRSQCAMVIGSCFANTTAASPSSTISRPTEEKQRTSQRKIPTTSRVSRKRCSRGITRCLRTMGRCSSMQRRNRLNRSKRTHRDRHARSKHDGERGADLHSTNCERTVFFRPTMSPNRCHHPEHNRTPKQGVALIPIDSKTFGSGSANGTMTATVGVASHDF